MDIVIFGGAGFVGSSLAIYFKKRYPSYSITCFDNLTRRGSEINLSLLKDHGIEFVHGDIRNPEDLEEINGGDIFVDASADPSVMGGIHTSPMRMINTNLNGTINLLELAVKHDAYFSFISTSRVYSIPALCEVNVQEAPTRFNISADQEIVGVCPQGIIEDFPTSGFRSFYGSAKLASELMIQEYFAFKGLKGIINRCGVIAGPGQFGKVDQGVLLFWLMAHLWKKPLSYIGFNGSGKQVRDFLHVADLSALIDRQIHSLEEFEQGPYNVGGGIKNSLSLQELTAKCEEITGNKLDIQSVKQNRDADIPIYITDNSRIEETGWTPNKNIDDLLADAYSWILENETKLKTIF